MFNSKAKQAKQALEAQAIYNFCNFDGPSTEYNPTPVEAVTSEAVTSDTSDLEEVAEKAGNALTVVEVLYHAAQQALLA